MAARVTLLLLDGAVPEVFQHLVNCGDLPHLSRHLLSAGGITPATTVFPSTTGVAYLPLLTGCYPGTCQVPGIRWLDRKHYAGHWWRDRAHIRSYCGTQGGMLNADLPGTIPTLFDIEPDSLAICTPFSRGLASSRVRLARTRTVWGGLAHYTSQYRRVDEAVGDELVRQVRARHRFTFAVFPGVDGVSHFHGPWHEDVLAVYRDFDRHFGRFVEAGGLDGDHLTLVVSDHGHSPVTQHVDLATTLEAARLRVLRHPMHLWRHDPHVAVMVSGNSSAQLYLRPDTARTETLSWDAIEAGDAGVPRGFLTGLAQLPGVALVVASQGEEVVVQNATGISRLRWLPDGHIAHSPLSGDPLGLGPAASYHQREWLSRTFDGDFPDAPAQLLQLQRSSRTGDVIMIAAPGTDFREAWEYPPHASGHGSLHRAHMHALVAANRRWDGPIRTPDLFHAMVAHLGYDDPSDTDGVLP